MKTKGHGVKQLIATIEKPFSMSILTDTIDTMTVFNS